MRAASAAREALTESGPRMGYSLNTMRTFVSLRKSSTRLGRNRFAVRAPVVEEFHYGNVSIRIAADVRTGVALQAWAKVGQVLALLFPVCRLLARVLALDALQNDFRIVHDVIANHPLDGAALRIRERSLGLGRSNPMTRANDH